MHRGKFRVEARTILSISILGSCLLALAGCAVGPDFHKPEAKVPSEWHGLSAPSSAGQTVVTAEQGDLAAWWNNFEDPILASLVDRALRSNLDLKQAEARIRQARAAKGVAGAALWPEVNASGQYQRSGTGGGSGGPGERQGTGSSGFVGNFFQVGLDASWELDFFGGTRRNIEASGADLQAALEDRRDVLVTLVSDVGTNYARLRMYQFQVRIAQNNLTAQQRTAEITRKRHGAGYVGALDVANAQAQAAATESQIPVLEAAARSSIYTLSLLLGQEPSALQDELGSEKPIPPTPPTIPAGLPSDLLRRRPDIRRTEAQVHAATARIGVATADLFPRFSLTGSFGFSGNDISSLGNWTGRSWSWGPSATWPIFDAGRIRWNIEVQNALQEQALLTYEKAILTALKDVETALVSYEKELQHNSLLAEAVRNNQNAVRLSMTLYLAGKTDFLNVASAQRAQFLSEDALAQSTNNLTTYIIALYKALGGGWEQPGGAAEAQNGGRK